MVIFGRMKNFGMATQVQENVEYANQKKLI